MFDEAGPDLDMDKVKSVDGDSKAKVEWIRAKNAEIDDHAAKVEQLIEVAKAAQGVRDAEEREEKAKGGERGDGARDRERGGNRKSIGEYFTESDAYLKRAGKTGPEAHLDVDLKSLFQTGDGWAPEAVRGPRVVDFVTAPIQFTDLIPQTTTSQNAVVYMEETTFVNNAAEVAEGGPFPESALGLEEKNSPVRKIATWLPITDEQLEVIPQARAYVNNRLPFMVRQRLDSQLLLGDGTNGTLRGLLNTPGIQTQAKGGDPIPDAVYKAMTKIKVNGLAMPDATIWNPEDWQTVRLLRTTDGIYIWGSPSEPGPARIWGLPVVEIFGMTKGTTALGAFGQFSELAVRRGMDVQVSNSHGEFFVSGKQAVRADIRVAVIYYRPAAFATVTGL
ncbi:hypothetical protein amrb99_97930 [Actinomadura sp. RB99]|nr:hypothetical protein [Actinomadura sp. RB99]